MGLAGRMHGSSFVLSAVVAACLASASPDACSSIEYESWLPLLRNVIASGGEVDDVYKLVHQGTMGPAHAVKDLEVASQRLAREWGELGGLAALTDSAVAVSPPRVAALESIRPDGRLVRVHLRPLLRGLLRDVPPPQRAEIVRLALDRLALAFQRTAASWPGDLGELRLVWERAVADSTLWSDRASAQRAADLTVQLRLASWPAVHHSDSYRRRWAPHYRVVAVQHLPPAWRLLDGERGERP